MANIKEIQIKEIRLLLHDLLSEVELLKYEKYIKIKGVSKAAAKVACRQTDFHPRVIKVDNQLLEELRSDKKQKSKTVEVLAKLQLAESFLQAGATDSALENLQIAINKLYIP